VIYFCRPRIDREKEGAHHPPSAIRGERRTVGEDTTKPARPTAPARTWTHHHAMQALVRLGKRDCPPLITGISSVIRPYLGSRCSPVARTGDSQMRAARGEAHSVTSTCLGSVLRGEKLVQPVVHLWPGPRGMPALCGERAR